MKYVALLRAINLGATRQVKMAALRDLYEDLGLAEVVTYLQSGNVVFTAEKDDSLTHRLETAMQKQFGFDVPTILIPGNRFRKIAAGCPYQGEAKKDPRRVHGLFVDPPPKGIDIDPADFHPEEFTLGNGVIYMHLPKGMQGSRLTGRLGKAVDGTKWTMRNWRTVANLAEML